MQKNLFLRHRAFKLIRDYFDQKGFWEVETPIMIKGTPEGSREYLVPSRLHHGKFYVLPQSPQQLKQLLMVGGIEKYFQIAKCFRDEDQRGDRQPEFTQCDMEMSFVEEVDIQNIISELILKLISDLRPDMKILDLTEYGDIKTANILKLTYAEVMEKYGSDKPDLRFDLSFKNISNIAQKSGFGVFEKAGSVYALCVSKKYGELTRKDIDELTELAKKHGAGGLAWLKAGEQSGPVCKNSNLDFLNKLTDVCNAQNGDLIFFGAGDASTALEPLGQVRLAIADRFNLRDPNVAALLWVNEFPMFEKDKEGNIGAVHHPFTRPMKEDELKIDTNPLDCRAIAYDLVMNGSELGGGSIRIHEKALQNKIFDILNISKQDAEKRFGHMLRAFEYGAPPHGGLALGLDRVIMLLANEHNIREVMAFPKNQNAQDVMLGAPSPMPVEQTNELGIKVIEEV